VDLGSSLKYPLRCWKKKKRSIRGDDAEDLELE